MMNLICIAIEIALINTLGDYIFEFDQFPDWAERKVQMLNISRLSTVGSLTPLH